MIRLNILGSSSACVAKDSIVMIERGRYDDKKCAYSSLITLVTGRVIEVVESYDFLTGALS